MDRRKLTPIIQGTTFFLISLCERLSTPEKRWHFLFGLRDRLPVEFGRAYLLKIRAALARV